jgi:hypothetical protein
MRSKWGGGPKIDTVKIQSAPTRLALDRVFLTARLDLIAQKSAQQLGRQVFGHRSLFIALVHFQILAPCAYAMPKCSLHHCCWKHSAKVKVRIVVVVPVPSRVSPVLGAFNSHLRKSNWRKVNLDLLWFVHCRAGARSRRPWRSRDSAMARALTVASSSV